MIYGQVSSACLSMFRKNEGHCLTYGQGGVYTSKGQGGRVWGRVGFSIVEFLAKCKKPQSHHKATTKTTTKKQVLDFQGFGGSFWGFWV